MYKNKKEVYFKINLLSLEVWIWILATQTDSFDLFYF